MESPRARPEKDGGVANSVNNPVKRRKKKARLGGLPQNDDVSWSVETPGARCFGCHFSQWHPQEKNKLNVKFSL